MENFGWFFSAILNIARSCDFYGKTVEGVENAPYFILCIYENSMFLTEIRKNIEKISSYWVEFL